jgi:beta-phosphoglucomutase family hydrolase
VAPSALGLPDGIHACLFDLDGVLTRTAAVHEKAWAQLFDAFLQTDAPGAGADRRPFTQEDYDRHIDGKPRADGVRDFLASRGIHLTEGTAADPPEADTVTALGTRKNRLLLQMIERDGVEVYPGSLAYLRAVRSAGILTAVVSASTNCRQVVQAAKLEDYLDDRVDGATVANERLRGKPAPDTFLAAAASLGVRPQDAAVFEDAAAGVAAGKAGGFGYVVGVDRGGHADELRRRGADRVVEDLAELLEDP